MRAEDMQTQFVGEGKFAASCPEDCEVRFGVSVVMSQEQSVSGPVMIPKSAFADWQVITKSKSAFDESLLSESTVVGRSPVMPDTAKGLLSHDRKAQETLLLAIREACKDDALRPSFAFAPADDADEVPF